MFREYVKFILSISITSRQLALDAFFRSFGKILSTFAILLVLFSSTVMSMEDDFLDEKKNKQSYNGQLKNEEPIKKEECCWGLSHWFSGIGEYLCCGLGNNRQGRYIIRHDDDPEWREKFTSRTDCFCAGLTYCDSSRHRSDCMCFLCCPCLLLCHLCCLPCACCDAEEVSAIDAHHKMEFDRRKHVVYPSYISPTPLTTDEFYHKKKREDDLNEAAWAYKKRNDESHKKIYGW